MRIVTSVMALALAGAVFTASTSAQAWVRDTIRASQPKAECPKHGKGKAKAPISKRDPRKG